jgi:hypothetical protein
LGIWKKLAIGDELHSIIVVLGPVEFRSYVNFGAVVLPCIAGEQMDLIFFSRACTVPFSVWFLHALV